jgi:hypothetical protein
MVIEERTYTLHPGKVQEFLEHAETLGLPVLKRHLGRLIGYFHTEIGTLNQIVPLWAYEDMGERERRRAACAQDPEFARYAAAVLPLIQKMENRILIPASFNDFEFK